MGRRCQRGSSLIETAIALAIVALIAGAALGASVNVLHAASRSPVRDALETEVRRQLRIALDALKYQGADIPPAVIATTLPMPAGTPLPASVALATSGSAQRELQVTVTATATRSSERVTLSATLAQRAPTPGTVLQRPGLVPAPTGAP